MPRLRIHRACGGHCPPLCTVLFAALVVMCSAQANSTQTTDCSYAANYLERCVGMLQQDPVFVGRGLANIPMRCPGDMCALFPANAMDFLQGSCLVVLDQGCRNDAQCCNGSAAEYFNLIDWMPNWMQGYDTNSARAIEMGYYKTHGYSIAPDTFRTPNSTVLLLESVFLVTDNPTAPGSLLMSETLHLVFESAPFQPVSVYSDVRQSTNSWEQGLCGWSDLLQASVPAMFYFDRPTGRWISLPAKEDNNATTPGKHVNSQLPPDAVARNNLLLHLRVMAGVPPDNSTSHRGPYVLPFTGFKRFDESPQETYSIQDCVLPVALDSVEMQQLTLQGYGAQQQLGAPTLLDMRNVPNETVQVDLHVANPPPGEASVIYYDQETSRWTGLQHCSLNTTDAWRVRLQCGIPSAFFRANGPRVMLVPVVGLSGPSLPRENVTLAHKCRLMSSLFGLSGCVEPVDVIGLADGIMSPLQCPSRTCVLHPAESSFTGTEACIMALDTNCVATGQHTNTCCNGTLAAVINYFPVWQSTYNNMAERVVAISFFNSMNVTIQPNTFSQQDAYVVALEAGYAPARIPAVPSHVELSTVKIIVMHYAPSKPVTVRMQLNTGNRPSRFLRCAKKKPTEVSEPSMFYYDRRSSKWVSLLGQSTLDPVRMTLTSSIPADVFVKSGLRLFVSVLAGIPGLFIL